LCQFAFVVIRFTPRMQVRSLTLDTWEPETIDVMLNLGNTSVNRVFEGKLRVSALAAHAVSARDRMSLSHSLAWTRSPITTGVVSTRLSGQSRAAAGVAELPSPHYA
jgi:hypothetical protein